LGPDERSEVYDLSCFQRIHRNRGCQLEVQIELIMGEAYSSETNVYEHGIAVEGDEHPESLGLIATAKLPIYADPRPERLRTPHGAKVAIVPFAGQ
jgi:hypothetical protein